jgi:hypothetical protein
VEEPKIFRENKGKEIVYDAKRLNSIKRPTDKAMLGVSVVVGAEDKAEKSMADESFSDDTSKEETKHDTLFQGDK